MSDLQISKYLNPVNYKRSLVWHYHKRAYDKNDVVAREMEKFAKHGLDFDKGEAALNDVLAKLGRPAFDSDFHSIHWLLFGCMSLNGAAKRILELGTFDGNFTAILAELFPDAAITTVDLPESDPILRATYKRTSPERYARYLAQRQENLARPNVEALEINTFFLLDRVKGPFDIVWADAGHLYPEIAWDMCNAYHLARPGGAILCDDVIPHPKGFTKTGLGNPDSHQVLRYIGERVESETTYFLKRWGAEYAAKPRERKFVALMVKPGRAS